MKVDLRCPVEILQCSLPENSGDAFSLFMINLSGEPVVSLQVTLQCFDREGSPLNLLTLRAHDLSALPDEHFSVKLTPDEWNGDTEAADIIIDKVWFRSGIVWRREDGSEIVTYTSNALPAGRALDRLRYAGGPELVGYPQQQN